MTQVPPRQRRPPTGTRDEAPDQIGRRLLRQDSDPPLRSNPADSPKRQGATPESSRCLQTRPSYHRQDLCAQAPVRVRPFAQTSVRLPVPRTRRPPPPRHSQKDQADPARQVQGAACQAPNRKSTSLLRTCANISVPVMVGHPRRRAASISGGTAGAVITHPTRQSRVR